MENNIIALRIKELRTSQKLTQSDFAESINTTQAALSGYERGDRTPSLDILISISQKYNVSIDWLCGQSETKNLTQELSTYSDLIKIILLFSDAEKFIVKTYLEGKESTSLPFPFNTLSINIDDKHIIEFYNEWKEISSIRRKSPSGEKLYAIWLKDIFERFNYPLERASSDFDEEMPFN